MKTEIIVLQEIKTVPASIEFDFEGAKSRLELRLEPFKNVVTEDNIAQAKKEKAEINKIKASIDDARKIESANATVNVREFDLKMRELCGLCADGYNLLNDQIIKFEAVTKTRILGFLMDELSDAWDGLRVEEEFRKGTVDHLATLSNANDAGIPNKKTKELVKYIAQTDFNEQQKVNMRLMQLENEGLKAGVIGLKKIHVKGFLFSDDETYTRQLSALIDEEKARAAEAHARFFAESTLIHESERQEMAAAANVELPTEYAEQLETVPPTPGTIDYTIYVEIKTSVDPHITPEFIAETAKERFKKAGFKNISSVSVVRS